MHKPDLALVGRLKNQAIDGYSSNERRHRNSPI
ncbi:MAG: hypothetical protein ACI8XG_002327 [Congregibacter sp.]|jgi:hypothetical protein